MGANFSTSTQPPQSYTPPSTSRGESNLKLEAQKVKDFSGDANEWQKWKSRTECAFDGSGYENILKDEEYAEDNERQNKIVYSQLAAATVDGIAHHLVKAHEDTKDGHAAWKSLCEWYDGDVVQSETADELRSKLDTLKLHSGTTAGQYINKFLMWYSDIAKIPGESLSPSHGVYLFLKNITDPDYKTTVEICQNNGADLNACVAAIRKAEKKIARDRASKRKLRTTTRRVEQDDDIDKPDNVQEQSNKRKRPINHNYPNKPKRLKGEVHTNDKGRIHFRSRDWRQLTDDEKTWVQTYNAAIKHGESTKEIKPPQGVTIVNNKARRVTTTEVTEGEAKSTTKSKKRITFNLEDPIDSE